ncbi:MAG: hypothetical protein CM1200mP22_13290 [Dehalococcoidia bacterium]|nr:MAG: hypothetical protein CM1200mP22_13290 [Dehalococcoidia bacterium]
MHIAGNMMFLWVFGDNIEDKFGHVRYLIFYLVTGIAATLVQWAINTDSQVPLIGASGAISGVLGAYLVIYPHNKIKALIILYIITVLEMRAMWLLGRGLLGSCFKEPYLWVWPTLLAWRSLLILGFRGRDSISGRLQAF